MTDNPAPDTPSVDPVEVRLREVAQLLRDTHALDPESRRTLAALVDELGTALRAAPVPPAEAAHLVETTAHLAESLHHQHDRSRLGQARDALEGAVLAAEAHAPFAAGLARRLMDALANIGI